MRGKASKILSLLHQYLGYSLLAIIIYALSGILKMNEDTDFLKQTNEYTMTLEPGLSISQLERALGFKNLQDVKIAEQTITFSNGIYNRISGEAYYVRNELPWIFRKITMLYRFQCTNSIWFLFMFLGLTLLYILIGLLGKLRPIATL